ncbi:hypothetical protein PG997_010875 [Apiospora hydei]|uniref:Uncharacterized protein n=1 Tax=Apiospora hydei TaxID=1337664 RepID=A0ABR1VIG4_9PEZI
MLELLSAGANVHGRIPWIEPGLCRKPAKDNEAPLAKTVTSCTLLLAARRSHNLTREYLETLPTDKPLLARKRLLERLVKLLEDGGAVEQEWDDEDNLIYPLLPTQKEAAIADESPAKDTAASQQSISTMPLKSDDKATKPGAESKKQDSGPVKEEKNGSRDHCHIYDEEQRIENSWKVQQLDEVADGKIKGSLLSGIYL